MAYMYIGGRIVSLDDFEHGWFLGQIDDMFSDDYDEELYKALSSIGPVGHSFWVKNDRIRRAVGRFIADLVEVVWREAKEVESDLDGEGLARVAADVACVAGLIVSASIKEENVSP